MGEFNIKTLRLEGQLSKYTNVMRGYQLRYFVVNPELLRLDYFMSEDMKHQKPRGSISLQNGVISPSEEDSTTFIIHTFDNELFKLRAQDAKERQHWVNVLRFVSQSSQSDELNNNKSDNNSSKNTNSVNNHNSQTQKYQNENTFELLNEVFNQVRKNHQSLENLINNLPLKGAVINKYDKDILILKAAARSCQLCVNKCCSLLKLDTKKEQTDFFNNESSKDYLNCNSREHLNDSNRYSSSLMKSLSLNDKTQNEYQSNLLVKDKNAVDSSCSSSSSSLSNNLKSTKLNLSSNLDEEITDEEENSNNSNTNEQDMQLFEDNKNKILHVLPNLKIGMDLTKVSIPTFMLENRSLLEMFADCMIHPDLFVKISDENSAEERMFAVLEWYLLSFHTLKKENQLAKKPFNPIIGETFTCSWKVNDPIEKDKHNIVNFVAEQVSHHPAISAFYVECKQKKIKLNCSLYTKSKYLGMSISVQLIGELSLKLEKFNEEYNITLPSCYARSIVTKPWIELGDICTITCPQTGYSASIEFIIKPFYGEQSNQINAEVKNKSDEIICRVKGEWNGLLEFDYPLTNKSKSINTSVLKTMKKRVRPLNKQERNESRTIWLKVAQCLKKNDINSATHFKSVIEKQQRSNEKMRKEKNIDYLPKYFKKLKINNKRNSLNSIKKSNQDTDNERHEEYTTSDEDLKNECNEYGWFYKNWLN